MKESLRVNISFLWVALDSYVPRFQVVPKSFRIALKLMNSGDDGTSDNLRKQRHSLDLLLREFRLPGVIQCVRIKMMDNDAIPTFPVLQKKLCTYIPIRVIK